MDQDFQNWSEDTKKGLTKFVHMRTSNSYTCLLVFLALITLFTSCNQTAKKINNPNVLFVSIDDLNNWVGTLGGHPQAHTPALDQFAEGAMQFANAYCTNPACNPSRTSIMTGLAPHTSGVYSNYQDWREAIPEYQTIGNYFREHGYYTAGAGKIFHYHMIDSSCWDAYWPSQKKNMPTEYLPQNHPAGEEDAKKEYHTINMPEFKNMYKMFDWAALDIPDSLMGDYQSVEWVSDRLQQVHDKPFFLACGIYRPHAPWYVPQEYFDLFPIESIQLPDVLENDLDDLSDRMIDVAHRSGNYHKHVVEADQWKAGVQGYLASIAFADAMFARLMDALERSDYADNTIVLVWSDHGWQLGEKEHWRKFALWENVLQTVLMLRVPDGVLDLPDGQLATGVCRRIVSTQDIYPSLLDLCNLPERTDIDGRSLVPLLLNPTADWNYPAISSYDYSEFSVRTEGWRYTRYIDGSEELYDHSKDPEEWYNLAGQAEMAAQMDALKKYIPEHPAPLVKTSEKLQPHHDPPFRTRQEYDDWLAHGKDNVWRIQTYWNNN